ncbi:uncharacterized protein N7515_002624 [Penicillium bovifimosum]|uniref:RNA polymerase II subunit B1 CTD phosphatase RPAP2 homolog n=1 Tax=Penicillium bovifimosum TaxID=126998 RepID=A0A9W9L9V4_9EURO|nr:uncharacterized protein N7515_002624 [Penicillium bovifimosum]KAJ5143837.1 hypothetical protein N7515_002624 [Penicillium bovifimosum]
MDTQQSQTHALKTSLPKTYAAVNAQQRPSYIHPSEEEQDKYLKARPGATQQHLEIALQHAQQIQSQKEAEDVILDRILELLELPSSSTADPATPSQEDTMKFKTSLVPFRPTDYDNLILERNFEESCGYTLCPRKHRKQKNGPGGGFQFKYGLKGSGPGGRGRSVEIVPQEQIEKWCSDACAERALFIRVQLSEKPVWERRASDTRGTTILLLEEARQKRLVAPAATSSVSSVLNDLQGMGLGNSDRSRELAMERGDTSLTRPDGRVNVDIRENERGSQHAARAPQMRPEDANGGSIEGYMPRGQREESVDADGDRDMLDQI